MFPPKGGSQNMGGTFLRSLFGNSVVRIVVLGGISGGFPGFGA